MYQSVRAFGAAAFLMLMVGSAYADSWTGFYLGVNAGGHWGGNNSISVTPADLATATAWGLAIDAGAQPTSLSLGKDGFIGGGQIGYALQIGTVVVGAEADFSGLDASESRTVITTVAPFVQNSTTATHDIESLGTVRARGGVLVSPELLAYITGGLAYGRVKNAFRGDFNATNDHFAGSESGTETGWTIGGGLDWALTKNWIVRGEYIYYDLGDTNFTTTGSGDTAASGAFNATAENNGQIGRAGLNYKF